MSRVQVGMETRQFLRTHQRDEETRMCQEGSEYEEPVTWVQSL
jgi:hypothetical protein